ncbi:pirin family protein [Rivularia sp. UHCC 0363]|uniref:pirin family protein n=1 Tax=Rivularia sp. UHCC 0363 TaxID=3110244 RepID=UPI002B20D535|nr:pirin family protein [Rivularia sp. UHCC 0363]MEA5593634.1 pirin family protein [Rivularia sp. UHCC 0363]
MSGINQIIQPHLKDLGGFEARRCLPNKERQMVGPFIFFDHLGPAVFPVGKGVDVRPHPHINLATVTYLLEGELLHRDSVGTVQEIQPGAVNWMSAGKGIVHSERSPDSSRNREATLHAIQIWVALPDEHEETEPWFRHYPADNLPVWDENGVKMTLIVGKAYNRASKVETVSPMFYLDVQLAANTQFTLPDLYSQRAIYSITSGLSINDQPLEQHQLAVLNSGDEVKVSANTEARCIVFGGESVGDRYKWWNFVSSSPERIEQAKRDWKEQRFSKVPQEEEFIPLPSDDITEFSKPQPLS